MAELVDLSWLKPLPEFRERKPGEPRAEYQAQLMAFKQEAAREMKAESEKDLALQRGSGTEPSAATGASEPKESTTPLRKAWDRVSTALQGLM